MIKLPDFDLIGDCTSNTEMVNKLADAAARDQFLELRTAHLAFRHDAAVKDWYYIAANETLHELTHANGDQLLP